VVRLRPSSLAVARVGCDDETIQTRQSREGCLPRKLRELIRDLEQAGFSDRGGRGSHRNFVHPKVQKPISLSGQPGDDAKQYQERAVRLAIEESRR
jgi:predicted RNA binding protein YcfA (HicA-like mRNA interferase family)